MGGCGHAALGSGLATMSGWEVFQGGGFWRKKAWNAECALGCFQMEKSFFQTSAKAWAALGYLRDELGKCAGLKGWSCSSKRIGPLPPNVDLSAHQYWEACNAVDLSARQSVYHL